MNSQLARTEFKVNWPELSIIKNDQPTFTLSNTTKLPISIKRNQIINLFNDENLKAIKINHTPIHPPSDITSHYLEIKIETQNQLHPQQREQFKDTNKTYQNVFKENFQAYNRKSDNNKFDVNFEPTVPPLTTGRLTVYNSDNLRLLQEKFDELESLRVLA